MSSPHPLRRYAHWLHTQWPAGTVERLPEVRPDGSTNVEGLYVVGDLTGVPLLKFSSDSGARAVQTIAADPAFERRTKQGDTLDLVIVGAGVSGMAAALEARRAGLRFEILEATEPFSTIVNFPKGKPIYTYPTDMTPAGELQFTGRSSVKEGLLEELREETIAAGIQTRAARAERITRTGGALEVSLADKQVLRAHRVIVGIGRSGNFRKLGVPGEDLDKVYNRLHDPKDFCGQNALVVGGGDSALETAVALGACGAHVVLSYRKPELSRPKPDNVEKLRALSADPMADVAVEEPSSERVTTAAGGFLGEHREAGSVRLMLGSQVKEIRDTEVVVTDHRGHDETLDNDAVFSMIGREAPWVNMVGQVILAVVVVLMLLRIAGWIRPESWTASVFRMGFDGYAWFVDLFLAGIVGYGVYFWYSGRVWCRFACPLAALMHIYSRFSRFRILSEKKKCISCNVCTSVCHQGIDVMNFANKGLPMEDPECVRCSACVQSCPTGVLSFGQVDRKTGERTRTDPPWLAASNVRRVELEVRRA